MKRLLFFSLAVLLMTGCKQQDDESMFPDRPDVREYVVTTDEAENAAFYFLYMTDNQVQTRNAVRDVKDAPVIKKKFTIEGYNGKPAMHVRHTCYLYLKGLKEIPYSLGLCYQNYRVMLLLYKNYIPSLKKCFQ